ncbi:MAG TPA: formate--tetrahydrofolate ligase, partial [Spirochaetia bacterium]|nr:formate--tetrahydrofolate ligase [Spirochaetia bacterium]
LRSILVGLGGRGVNGMLREDGFEITAASEVMAILCLSRDLNDLKNRLGRIVAGYDQLKRPVFAAELGAAGAMAALLKNAIHPNLVQSVEGTPVLVHGGPFANIAHGCNTLTATRLALKLGEIVVTEAGFGSDLGAEKFFDIKCRAGNLTPAAAVLVVTRRAYALHGIENVAKHVENIRQFGVEPLISINKFLGDPDSELLEIQKRCRKLGAASFITDYREQGGNGGLELAEAVWSAAQAPPAFRTLYDTAMPLEDKIRTIACAIYGAAGVEYTREGMRDLKRLSDLGFGELPVCMAKTPASLSDDPKASGRPTGFTLTVSGARVSSGAGFVVVYTGDVMTMPGLPKDPAFRRIDVDADGRISGLF